MHYNHHTVRHIGRAQGDRALTEARMPLVAVMLEGIMLGFLYRKATTGPFIPAGPGSLFSQTVLGLYIWWHAV